MDANENDKESKAKSPVRNTALIRVSKETARAIKKELARINKKDYGRRIGVENIVALAITKLTDHDFQSLHEKSLSNADRLELRYQNYCEKHGAVSKDEFLGLLLSGASVDEAGASFVAQREPVSGRPKDQMEQKR